MWDEQYALRDGLVEALERDLVGPRASEDEQITDAPFQTYISGVLYPRTAGTVPEEEQDDGSDDGSETSDPDPAVSLANARYPSSMGLTFAVDANRSASITVNVAAARYVQGEDDHGAAWRREPARIEAVRIDVTTPVTVEEPIAAGLALYRNVRPAGAQGFVAVTLALVNRLDAPPFRKDAFSWFQCRVAVTADAPGAFVERSPGDLPIDDDDLRSYRLLYRDVHNFAVGHGTSVEWDLDGGGRASWIATRSLPAWELLLADSNPDIPTDRLSMRSLARDSRPHVIAGLTELSDRYAAWIEGLTGNSGTLPDGLRTTAELHVQGCVHALARIRSGIQLLASPDHDDVWRAFRLANLAMLRQRARARWVTDGKPEIGPQEDDSHVWRPFQIAFILLNLDGIADHEHADRACADLLWFPTGGGKTEAYLGLIAFTILLRRLRRQDQGDGVTVIMRYTLRLLTIQQFERAASLVVGLEIIRRDEVDLGRAPVSIGLWVGKDGTPATLTDARAVLDKLRANVEVERGNPVQVRACPWCGTKLDHRAYWIARDNPRLVISCRDKACAFAKGLPIHVVDEDIYAERPSLIIATADKFATLPWVKGVYPLFGVGSASPPPELIVQDELHLISGPLGTLAGLYEAAIDLLCTRAGVRPKVIASTATIRRAHRQTEALFDRAMRQFPPPGVDATDSFFAVTADRSAKPSRLYVGALGPGTSHSTLMIRVYAALMQAAYESSTQDEIRDAYWTLVGYFNSLRVLGGARIQVLDDVRERLRVVTSAGREARPIPHAIELTSREPSSAIPSHLEALARSLPDPETLDYVLATNMISVGVDIDRLGLMVVMGQPQGTAEYIQATSRVGRQHPGIVVTLFNAGRSRDRSHYESFPNYHGALYRQVESTSVTPFSPRARDRALHALLIALARVLIPDMRDNNGARRIAAHLDELRSLAETISQRAERIGGDGAVVRDEFERVLQQWVARADETPALVYTNPHDAVNSLMTSADRTTDDGLPTPSSLRDVDRESNLYLTRF
jgi:hypothetical protein